MVTRKPKILIDPFPNPDPIDYDAVRAGLELLYAHPDEPVAVDTETTGLLVTDERNYCIGISYAAVIDGEPVSGYLATAHVVGENAPPELVDMLAWILTEQGRTLYFQNVQFDINSLLTIGIDCREVEFYDLPTMVNCGIDENMPMKSLEAILKKFASHVEKITDDEWLNDQKENKSFADTTPERMWKYAVNDAEVTYLAALELLAHPEWRAMDPSVWSWKQREIRALIEMSRRGVRLDANVAKVMAALSRKRMAELTAEVDGVNLGSRNVLEELLINQLGLPVLKRSPKTGDPGFDKEVMAEYEVMLEQMDSPLARIILGYRGWQKATTAGYEAYLNHVSPDGRVRTTYTTHVVRTGRLSSKKPNLQQIPKESDREKKPWNWQMKACFIPSPGFTMWGIDYSQLELRLMASFAGVDSLKQVFIEGRDIFTEIAETIDKPRQTVKTMVYANSYGAGFAKIARSVKVSEAEAKGMLNDYYASYPELRLFSRKLENMAKRYKKVPLWNGRFRHMPYPKEAYKAMNSFIQGGGADVVGRAMVRLHEEVSNDDCRMLMQIHDAFVFEIREGHEDEYLPRIEAIMTDVDALVADRIPNGLGTTFAVESEPWPVFDHTALEDA